MKSHSTDNRRGMTIMETVMYVALLSFLMSGFLKDVISIHLRDIELIHEINDAQN